MSAETFEFNNSQIISFLLIFLRIGAILLTAPFFGSRNIPIQVRILLSFAIAIIITSAVVPYKSIGSFNVESVQNPISMTMVVSREVMLGIAIGFIARLIFIGVQMAGQFISNDIGFGMMNILDPSSHEVVTIMAELNTVIATLIFLVTYSHHYILMAIAKSFDSIPIGSWGVSEAFTVQLNNAFSGIFTTGLRLALPIMGVLFLAKIAMAIITRTMPQMNIFVIGFPIQIMVGLLGFAISLPLLIRAIQSLFLVMRDNIWLILR